MTSKVIRQMLIAQILSALTVSLCLLIDNVMINRFLGVQAVAAYELANPLLLAVGAVASVLSAGVQVACSKSLGTGSQEETNRGFSTAIAIVLIVSIPVTVLVFLFRGPISALLGAGRNPELFGHTQDYLAGFVPGALPTMAALSLIPFLQMAGQSTLLIVAVLGMAVTDIGLDLISVFVLHGGMLGMGLASSISYFVALGIALCYFLSKKCAFRFSGKLVSLKKAVELFRSGSPNAFSMVSSVLMALVMNYLLIHLGGPEMVAAYAVVSGILSAANSTASGCSGVTLTLTGILFSEEDRKGLRSLLSAMLKNALVIGLLATAVLLLAAPALVSLFLKEQSVVRDMTVFGMRMAALGILPCCIENVAKSYYQGTGRIRQMAAISVLEGFLLPALAAWLLSLLGGADRIWLFFVVGQAMTVFCIFLYGLIQYRQGKNPILQSSFGIASENAMEARITSIGEVMDVSRRAEAFCTAHGSDGIFAKRIALCIEEMASNTVLHGFRPGKRNYLSVRVQCKPNQWILRFRDDCGAFDPVHYIPPENSTDGLGIRLVLGMSDDVRYTHSLNLNNLTILLNEPSGNL